MDFVVGAKMAFRDLRPGDRFRVDPGLEDEWYRRGLWIKTNLDEFACCLTQGVHDEGRLLKWAPSLSVILVQPRVLS